jgi:type VI secretion system protein ImpL
MKRFWNWLTSLAVLSAIGVLILSALVWWVGPLIPTGGGRHALDGWLARTLLVALLCLVWGLVFGWRAWRQRRANAALLRGMSAGAAAADREGELLQQRFREAMDKLKKAGKKSWFSSTSSLYELPWYVFVGAPGSGKTTALQNAGLQFLLTEGGAAASVKGVGGTRNCDWWFTSEAVLIDTAGRYTLQESDAAVDARAWDNFLALLRQGRPRRPINGVLLTVNIQDLLQQNITERKQHAQKLRERLHELQTKLGVRPPVYVLVTKTDLVAGFNETFDAFSKEQRDQVWGFTLPAEAGGAQLLASFDADFAALEQRLNSGLFERLQAERDGAKRAAMFAFPMEFASLRPVLGEFLGMVFTSGGALEEDVRLRGVYFTSGTQEGTPIDRVMGALSRSFGLAGRVAAVAGQRGKSFFLRRLLQDLIFTEQHLVAFNPVAERRRGALRGVGFAVVALLSLGLLAGWSISYMRNSAYAQQVAAKVPELQPQVDSLPAAQSGDVSPLPGVLLAVHQAAQVPEFAVDDPPLLNTLGLYQGDKLDAAAQIAYHKLLQHALLPRVARRLEERLRAANKSNLEQAYEALKSYLMLYTPDKFDPETLKAWVSVDWDVNYARSMSPEPRKALDQHLDALLALGAPGSVAPMDQTLVDATRDMLTVYPLEYRIYSRLKRSYRGDLPEFSVARAAGPNAAQVFERASGEALSKGISGFYSRDGYQKTFQGSVQPAAIKLAAEESWVLGLPAKTVSVKDLAGNELTDKVRRLYLEDYVKVWDAYLADVRLVRLSGIAANMNAARVLAAVDSPLAAYLRGVAKETTLVPAAGQASQSLVGKLADQASKAKDDMAKLAGAQPAPDAGNGPIERIVDDHFAAMNRLVQGNPAPIDDVLKMFGEVYAQLQAVDAAQKSKAPPPPPGGADKIKAAAGTQPEPIRSILTALADAGAKGSREGEREVLTSELKPIFDFCNRAVTNRYPFASGSQADVLPDDFGQLFGVGGMLDDFYQRRLANLVDTGVNPWRYKPLADGAKPATPAALAEFQRASRIKDGFFRGGGKQPSFRLEMRAVEMDPALKELTLDIDGQPLKFTAGNNSSVVINWPSQKVSSQVRLSGPGVTPLSFEGPWALFRMFDRFDVQPSPQPEKLSMQATLDGKRVRFEVIANSVINPFRMREIQQFRCPGAL